jgi:hypothetical protein
MRHNLYRKTLLGCIATFKTRASSRKLLVDEILSLCVNCGREGVLISVTLVDIAGTLINI